MSWQHLKLRLRACLFEHKGDVRQVWKGESSGEMAVDVFGRCLPPVLEDCDGKNVTYHGCSVFLYFTSKPKGSSLKSEA